MKISWLLVTQVCLFAAGTVLVEKCVVDLWVGHSFQHEHQEFAHATTSPVVLTPAGYEKTKILGRLRVPKLGLSVAVVEGDGDEQLRLAAGHVSGTPMPGQSGNSVIAGHRDTVFYDLRKIASGDRMEFDDQDGFHAYQVRSTRIVDPEEVSVMGNWDGRRLTLVTCYPFSFVGPAPKRFIVVAEEVSR